jgi:hypothetical protein
MAREAGFRDTTTPVVALGVSWEQVQRFAALVAAAEREAIAKSLDKQADLACDEFDRQWAQEMAAAVRARGNT